jgi:hypothetical protein
MTKTTKRKVTFKGQEYICCIRGNSLRSSGSHIAVYKEGANGQILYLDPYPWGFEIGPKFVIAGIEYAVQHHWKPGSKGAPMYLGYSEDGFVVLPKGMQSTYELGDS